MPNRIMDGFFKKVNEKVNLEPSNESPRGHRYVKGQIF